jgi:DNA-binding GntR family transcriptional regulator
MAAGELVRGLPEQIAQRLRNDILSGRLVEGERLSEMDLAERFGVSRGPVREALVQLLHEGMLVKQSNAGVKVAPAAPDSIRELLIPLRRTIETYALRVCFHELTAKDFRAWEEILQRLQFACQQRDYAGTAEQDVALHRSILVRARQPDLLAVWQTMVARIRRHFRESHANYADPMAIYEEHRALIDAFRTGDLEQAVQALARNIA